MTEQTIEGRLKEIPGPWNDEPNRVEFEHAGHPCLMVRGPCGHWCGYAAVPPGHPWHGLDWSDERLTARAHGGITYSRKCQGDVCHVAKSGEPDDVWWIGFDCAHSGDLVPTTFALLKDARWHQGDVYRGVDYVMAECRRLAEQCVEAAR